MPVQKVENKTAFTTLLKDAGDKLVVVDFYADWCGPCKQMTPKVAKLADDTPDAIFVKVDVDANEELAAEFKVTGIPMFACFKNGKLLESFAGANEQKLKDMIKKHATAQQSS